MSAIGTEPPIRHFGGSVSDWGQSRHCKPRSACFMDYVLKFKTFDALASPNPFKGLRVAKVRFKKKPSLDSLSKSEQGRRLRLPRPALAPRRPSELLSVLPPDRSWWFEPEPTPLRSST